MRFRREGASARVPVGPEDTLRARSWAQQRGSHDQNLVVIETLSARGEPGVMLKLLFADA
jgi:hypothetical protein